MDPLDQHRAALDGLTCAVCEGSVPSGSIHLLARRDDLAFVQVVCPVCDSTTLAFVPAGTLARGDGPGAAAAVTADDVLDMHLLLEGWQGGLAELLGRSSTGRSSIGAGPAS